jgi:hypothetical protein
MKSTTVLTILLVVMFLAFIGVSAMNLVITGEKEYYKSQFETSCEISNNQVDQINLLLDIAKIKEVEKAKKLDCQSFLLERG